jgi:hypothetical protein
MRARKIGNGGFDIFGMFVNDKLLGDAPAP